MCQRSQKLSPQSKHVYRATLKTKYLILINPANPKEVNMFTTKALWRTQMAASYLCTCLSFQGAAEAPLGHRDRATTLPASKRPASHETYGISSTSFLGRMAALHLVRLNGTMSRRDLRT